VIDCDKARPVARRSVLSPMSREGYDVLVVTRRAPPRTAAQVYGFIQYV
jgi:hypothetical protein